jgi:hypothetical protein
MQLCRLDATVPGNDLIIVVNQNGIIKSETVDAAGDLLDLLG